jgi:hypothetical protein
VGGVRVREEMGGRVVPRTEQRAVSRRRSGGGGKMTLAEGGAGVRGGEGLAGRDGAYRVIVSCQCQLSLQGRFVVNARSLVDRAAACARRSIFSRRC